MYTALHDDSGDDGLLPRASVPLVWPDVTGQRREIDHPLHYLAKKRTL